MTQENVAVSDPNPEDKEAPNQSVLIPEAKVAPVVPVVPTVVVDEPFAYEATGDVGLDMALQFVGKAGIGGNHPAMTAAQAGDFSILKATLAAKGTPGWEQFVALGEAAYARTAADTAARQAKDQASIFELAGGKDEWQAVQKWAGDNATPEEKTEINALLNQGGLAAKGAVQYLLSVYGKANNVTIDPKAVGTNASRGGVPSAAEGPLSARDYATAVGALNNKLNGRLDGSKEYENLQRRRAAFRG